MKSKAKKIQYPGLQKKSNVDIRKNTNYKKSLQNSTEAPKHLYQRQHNKINSMVQDSLSKYYETQKETRKFFESVNSVKPTVRKDE